MLSLSAVEVILGLVSALTCLLIISIWIRQAKEGRLTAISNVKISSDGSSTPKDANNATPQNLSQLQICVLFAHFEQVLWLGVGISLLRYTWYLYYSLRRKLGVVSPHLMEAIAEHDPAARGTRVHGAGIESDMAAGFSFTRRSIRNFSDVWGMMPVFIVVPVAIVGLVIKTCFRSVFCCYCMSSHNNDKTPISDQNRTVMEEEIQRKMKAKNVKDVFEAWPKWPKYMEDDPSSNHQAIGPSDHQLTEVRVHSSDIGSTSFHPTTAATIVSEHPTLAAKLRVTHLDLNDTHEESYGYDITKQRIRYHRDSWSHKTRVIMTVHQQLICDIIVCIVIPAIAFVPLFAIPAQDRAYDVYPDRGGCRVSSIWGSGDWIRMVVLLALNTGIAVFGLLFAILSIVEFKKQNGSLSYKMKSLTPSPAVLRLYKSTEIVKNILLLCVGLNMILALGHIIHLGLTVSSTIRSTSSNPPKPLFRLAERDQDVLLVILAILLVVVTYLKIFWASLRKNWRRLYYCFRDVPSEEDDDDSAHASNATFPNYPKPLEKGKLYQQRSIAPNRYPAQTISITTASTSRTSVDPSDNEMAQLESTKVDSCKEPSKPEQAAQDSDGRSTTDSPSIWLSSAPINADGALTAIPSTSTPCANLAPTLTSTNYDCEFDDLGDDEDGYDMETMGAISLEELVFDEPSTDHDSIHEPMAMTTMALPSDDRAMLENIVHHAFMCSAPPPMIPFSHRASSNRRSTGRSRGGRRPSVIQYSNSPYYGHGHGHGHGHISRTSSSRRIGHRSEDTCYHHHPLPLRGAYFQLVSRGINVVDLYGDADDDGEIPGAGAEFVIAAASRPRSNHHRTSSMGTLDNILCQSHTPQSYMLQRLSVKGKHSVGGGCVGGSAVLENDPPRPDSPTDLSDS
ncbi:hypothetical protein BGZ96_010891 [Linnemannia gamsii]|uniref:Uncharacterized protein n=1 Tax=Linnemannia gamsii TaxID=64522 RepID=A0ABQ7JTB7_9FUNG|nr:hypothetical protein BGZ96_010891 [Linnemannia gamsii]